MSDHEAVSRRAEASRRNGARSKGPTSAAGKERSRLNALKHGMRAATPVLPGEDQAAFDDRLRKWTRDLAPRDEVEQFLVKRAVALSWQSERAGHALALSRKPPEDTITALTDEVLALGRRLFWDPFGAVSLYPQKVEMDGMVRSRSWAGKIDDPDDPARLVNQLESTAIGCGWMLDRWAELREVLEAGLIWQAPDRLKAIRLLGKQPLDAATDRTILRLYCASGAMSPEKRVDFKDLADEMFQEQKTIFLERVNARMTPGLRPEDPEEGKAALLEIIAEEEERLEALLADHLERAEPFLDTGFDAGDECERLRRYQAACDRGLLRVLEALRKRHAQADRAAAAAAKAATASKRERIDQLRLISHVMDVMGGPNGTRGKRVADPLATVGAVDPAWRSATNEPKAAPAEAPATETNEPNAPAPAEAPAAPTNEPNAPASVEATNEPDAARAETPAEGMNGRNAPAPKAGPLMSSVLTILLALVVGLFGARAIRRFAPKSLEVPVMPRAGAEPVGGHGPGTLPAGSIPLAWRPAQG